MTKQEVKSFRGDFQKAVAQLEAQYGVRISLGTIRFDVNGLRAKMEAVKGDAVEVFDKDDFSVGETVKINHKKVNPNDQFRIVKIKIITFYQLSYILYKEILLNEMARCRLHL